MIEKLAGWISNFVWEYTGLIVVVMAMAIGTAGGWKANGWRLERRIAELQKQQADALSAATQKVLELERQGTSLAARLIESEEERTRTGKEKDDAIKRLSVGRHCLDGDLVRLLNGSGPGLRLPAPAGNPARAAATATADPGYATDTDIALWARNARHYYDLCRGRIDALNEFYKRSHDATGS